MSSATLRLMFVVLFTGMTLEASRARAELVGYWSADTTAGVGESLPNDQGNSDLDGELWGGAEYSADSAGHTGMPGDYAVSFPGEDEDYATLPPTDRTFEEITITAWVNGIQNGDWAGIVLSRDPVQAIGIDYRALDGMLTYIWNTNSAETYNVFSELLIPEDEWAFLALSITEENATLYVGPLGQELESFVNDIPHIPQDNFWEWRLGEDDCCDAFRNFSGLIDDVSIWDHALSEEELASLHDLSATPLTLGGVGTPGDFNNDGLLNTLDIDDLTSQSASGTNPPGYDLNGDALVNDGDVGVWVRDLFHTWIGDADLNGEFNSSDLIVVLASGTYEVEVNAVWSTGDFDGDGSANSSDLVAALADGGYEAGPRPAAVPEPSTIVLVCCALALVLRHRR